MGAPPRYSDGDSLLPAAHATVTKGSGTRDAGLPSAARAAAHSPLQAPQSKTRGAGARRKAHARLHLLRTALCSPPKQRTRVCTRTRLSGCGDQRGGECWPCGSSLPLAQSSAERSLGLPAGLCHPLLCYQATPSARRHACAGHDQHCLLAVYVAALGNAGRAGASELCLEGVSAPTSQPAGAEGAPAHSGRDSPALPLSPGHAGGAQSRGGRQGTYI